MKGAGVSNDKTPENIYGLAHFPSKSAFIQDPDIAGLGRAEARHGNLAG